MKAIAPKVLIIQQQQTGISVGNNSLEIYQSVFN